MSPFKIASFARMIDHYLGPSSQVRDPSALSTGLHAQITLDFTSAMFLTDHFHHHIDYLHEFKKIVTR
jgi:hypothetical protein